MKEFSLGLDIGSVAVKCLILENREAVYTIYKRHFGRIQEILEEILQDIIEKHPEFKETDFLCSLTGNGAESFKELLNAPFYNELVAISEGVAYSFPEAETVIEMGGEEAKLICFENQKGNKIFSRFETNGLCAAGTGSFLDQQSHRLGIQVEKQFEELALKSVQPPRIAGRCSVFAKSDMIHLQQVGTSMEDILYGLCLSVARNFKSSIAKGIKIKTPALFLGGVAYNKAMIRALKEVYGLDDSGLIVPENRAFYPALGAVLLAEKEQGQKISWQDLLKIISQKENQRNSGLLKSLKRNRFYSLIQDEWDNTGKEVEEDRFFRLDDKDSIQYDFSGRKTPVAVFLGIDIGSVSTNLVLIDQENEIAAKRYIMTSGAPMEAVKQGLRSIHEELGDKVKVKGAGVTGSGRYLIADFVGGDLIKNEITAQAASTVFTNRGIDTIFEIGGQDSKYIYLKDGVIADFEMNKVCAAGTGSFLEEQAEELGISIKDEFARLAFQSDYPAKLGERCTVFMESDLRKQFHQGAEKKDLLAGLAYSIVYNYLNKVVGRRKIGKKIALQGGVCKNLAVRAAFETILGQEIESPVHGNVTGALGIAYLTKQKYEKENFKTKFYGFDLSEVRYELKTFHCHECDNLCEIHRISIEGREPLFYGSRCDKYNVKEKSFQKELPDYFAVREKWLRYDYTVETSAKHNRKKKIGIPLQLIMYEYYPFWNAFFRSLGWEVVTTSYSKNSIIKKGLERYITDSCFPLKVAVGHVEELTEQKIDALFLPNFINLPLVYPNITHTHACPLIQSLPDTVRALFHFEKIGIELIHPNIQMKYGMEHLKNELKKVNVFKKISKKELKFALKEAYRVQKEFFTKIQDEGQKAIAELKENEEALVFIGRSYNTSDIGLNLNLPSKLSNLGVKCFPMDFLPLYEVDIAKDYPNMYWHYGQKILSAAKLIRENPKMYGVYITNFGCGADSYIHPYTEREFGNKPLLTLEIDEHSADAGVITRCEAFLDSIQTIEPERKVSNDYQVPNPGFHKKTLKERTIYIPHMGDPAYGVVAAFQAYGIDARIFEPSDEETLELGRKHSTGKECYPYLMTLGDIIKIIKKHGQNHDKVAFFMPSATGPCRFGQYHFFQNIILNELGYTDVYFVNPNQGKDFYKEFHISGKGFELLAWKSLLFIEQMDKMMREIRPYEVNQGETDFVYEKLLTKVCDTIKSRKEPLTVVDHVIKEFNGIPVKNKGQFPVVGIVGEIFVRNHELSNDYVARKLEAEEIEVWIPTTSEWVFYTNHTRKYHTGVQKDWKVFFSTYVMDKAQRYMERKAEKAFHKYLRNTHEPAIPDLLSISEKYISRQYESEACLTIAKSVDFFQKGAAGIANVMPFGCMPGNIVATIADSVRKEIGEIPWLNLVFDGNGSSDITPKIKAFSYQVKRKKI